MKFYTATMKMKNFKIYVHKNLFTYWIISIWSQPSFIKIERQYQYVYIILVVYSLCTLSFIFWILNSSEYLWYLVMPYFYASYFCFYYFKVFLLSLYCLYFCFINRFSHLIMLCFCFHTVILVLLFYHNGSSLCTTMFCLYMFVLWRWKLYLPLPDPH